MSLRVIVSGKPKLLYSGGEGKPSVNSATKSLAIDPKRDDLPMARVKAR